MTVAGPFRFSQAVRNIILGAFLVLGCVSPQQENPLDPSNPNYQPTTLDIVVDSLNLDSLRTGDTVKIGVSINYINRINSITVSFGNDTSITLSNISRNNNKVWLPAHIFQTTGSKTIILTTTTVNNQDAHDTLAVVIYGKPPVITRQPENLTIYEADSIKFAVTATGSLPMSYQWYHNTVAIPSATGASYAKANAVLGDSGSYYCMVTNDYGAISQVIGTATSVSAKCVVFQRTVDSTYPVVSFAAAAGSGAESVNGSAVIKLSKPFSQPVTVHCKPAVSSSAAKGSDFTFSADTLVTFQPNETQISLPIFVMNDTIVENGETVVLQLETPYHTTVGVPASFTYTVLDDDIADTSWPGVSFTIDTSSGAESVNGVFSVKLSKPYAQQTSVHVKVGAGSTAAADADYVFPKDTLLVFAPNELQKNLALPVINDTLVENTETVVLQLDSPVKINVVQPSLHTHRILDNDIADTSWPGVSFTSDTSSGIESVNGTFSVRLSKPYAQQASVHLKIGAGSSASSGADFNFPADTLIVFAPNEIQKNFALPIINDALAEPTEAVVILLETPARVNIVQPSVHTHQILDNDIADTTWPRITFDSAASHGTENVSASLGISLSKPWPDPVTVRCKVLGSSSAGGSDFAFTDTIITFAPNVVHKTLSIAVVDDDLHESDEVVVLGLESPSNTRLGTIITTTYTINDNDMVVASFSATGKNIIEATVHDSIMVVLTARNPGPVTVDYSVTTGTTASGNGVDFTLRGTGTLTFPALAETGYVYLDVVDDTIGEGDEVVMIALANPSSGMQLSATTKLFSYTIRDNETVTLSFGTLQSPFNENAGAVSIPVTLTKPCAGAVTVQYAINGGTAQTGSDFTLGGSVLTFAPGVTTASIPLTIIDDNLDENNETVILELSGITGQSALGTNKTHTVTITDNDVPTFSFGTGTSSVTENAGTVNAPVRLSAKSVNVLTVGYSINSGTADTGDYILGGTGTLAFQPGDTVANISLTIKDDSRYENAQTVSLQLLNGNGGTITTPSVYVLTINDNDNPPVASITVATSTVNEGDGTAIATVTFSAASELQATVNYVLGGGTASGSGVDYTDNSGGSITFAPGQTNTMILTQIRDDLFDEVNETVDITLTSATNASVSASQKIQTCTIIDNDNPPSVQFGSIAKSGSEGTVDSIPLYLSNRSGKTISAGFSMDGTAINGSSSTGDYWITEGATVTFNPGDSLRYVHLNLRSDGVDEVGETVLLTLSSALSSNTVAGTPAGFTFTIVNTDASPSIGFVTTTGSGNENVTAVNTEVRLSTASSKTVTVGYSVNAGGGTADATDYSLTAGTLTFSPGETSKNIPLTVVNDTKDEYNQSVVILLVAPVNATLGTSLNTYTILDDDAAPSVSFAVSTASGNEDAGSISAALNLSTASEKKIGVTVALSGTASNGVDYAPGSLKLVFNAGVTSQNFTFSIVDDSRNELGETIIVTESADSNVTTAIPTIYTYTIIDNDAIPVSVICVDATATGSNLGTSWPNAYTTLTAALTEFNGSGNTKSEIWIAKGTYTPPEGSRAGFLVTKTINLRGGFQGGEKTVGARTASNNNLVVLSGDLGTKGVISDNSTHVIAIYGAGMDSLEYLVIADGNANGGLDASKGGGIYFSAGYLSLKNSVLRNNSASGSSADGSALYCGGSQLVNCVFIDNVITSGYGAIVTTQSDLVQNCVFKSVSDAPLLKCSGTALLGIVNNTFVRTSSTQSSPYIDFNYSGIGTANIFNNIMIDGGPVSPGLGGTCTYDFRNCTITGFSTWGLTDGVSMDLGEGLSVVGHNSHEGSIIFKNGSYSDDGVWFTANAPMLITGDSNPKSIDGGECYFLNGQGSSMRYPFVPFTDIRGTARPLGVIDIGAYEQ